MQRHVNIPQIIEELSAGADEQMEPLRQRCEALEKENSELKREVADLKATGSGANSQ